MTRNINVQILKRRSLQLKAEIGISQRRQAFAMGFTPGSLNQYLLGNLDINYDALFRMCEYYGLSPFDVDRDLWSRVMHTRPSCIVGSARLSWDQLVTPMASLSMQPVVGSTGGRSDKNMNGAPTPCHGDSWLLKEED